MTRRQGISFRVGAIAALVTSAVHLVGHFSPRPAPESDAEATLLRLLTTYKKTLPGGVERTTFDFLAGFSLTFSVFLALTGALALIALRESAENPRALFGAALALSLGYGALFVVSLTYFFLPPTVCLGVAFLGFTASLIAPRRG